MIECYVCGCTFTPRDYGPLPRFCSQRCRDQMKVQRAQSRPPRAYECRSCGATILVRTTGPRALCDRCRELGPSVAVVLLRQRAERYVCAGCASPFERRPTKGQRPRWCPDCASGRGWKRANPGSRLRSDAKRRAAMRIEAETFAPEEIFERDGWRCQIPGCSQRSRRIRQDKTFPHPLSPSIDHIIPVSEGGHHLRTNVRAAHFGCNSGRGNRGGNDQLLLIG